MSRTAIVRGSVIDPSGAVIPGVNVWAKLKNHLVAAWAITEPDGSYELRVPFGTYEISANVPGFAFVPEVLHANRKRLTQDIRLTFPTIEQTTKVAALDRQKR